MLRTCQNFMVVAFLALISVIALQFITTYPIGTLTVTVLLVLNFLWPYIRDDGRRHMVFLPNGSTPFYDRRIWAVMTATLGYILDENRSANGFPTIDDFWESHLPN